MRRGNGADRVARRRARAGRGRARRFRRNKGLFGKPTNINNVETWYNIAPIVLKGPAWFTETGSTKSAGTKVFSLVGKIANTGLVEMPLGTPLSRFVYDVGGGALKDRSIKAVQTGGPSGGCIPHEMFDTPVDYETLAQLGSIMGSGGMVVMDEDNCMVDIARFFIEFTHSESCGKCVPCRAGLDQALRMLNGLTSGAGTAAQLDLLDELGRMIRDTSLCGLGQSAPNPVLTTHAPLPPRVRGPHHRAALPRGRVRQPGAFAVRKQLSAAHEHSAIPRTCCSEGRMADAFESVILDNPLPASTGRVCQHPCDNRCRRQTRGRRGQHARSAPVHRRRGAALGRFREHGRPVGGAQDGAHGQAHRGGGRRARRASRARSTWRCWAMRCTVFESQAEAGGMLRYAIPEYRLPKRVLAREVELIRRVGVEFRFECGGGLGHHAERAGRAVRRGVPLHRHVEGIVGVPGRERS